MNRLFGAAAIAAIGVAIGAGGMHALQAKLKPPAYGIAIIDIKDTEGYKKELTGSPRTISASEERP